jgi:hypothetical protein
MNDFNFDYLVEKIRGAEFSYAPFKHVYIENFFSEEHFSQITQSSEIKAPQVNNDFDLIEKLCDNGFEVIDFPGCTPDVNQYLDWRKSGKSTALNPTCEGFGVVMRLKSYKTPLLRAVNNFIMSDQFSGVTAEKFGVNLNECYSDAGIQKYLDGYEISPHPDVRKKATTFMVNINPDPSSEFMNHHTHLMSFISSREYIQKFWEGNPDIDRDWVPWSWATTHRLQNRNNTIVLFSPACDTLHGVKADYDHLKTQRTQLYGNLWYKENMTKCKLSHEQLDLCRLPLSA